MRFAVVVSLTFSAATLLAGAISFFLLSDELRGRLVDDARQMAENLASTYQSAGLPELQTQIAANVASTRDYSNLYLFVDGNRESVFGNFSVAAPFIGERQLVAGRDFAPGPGAGDIDSEVFQAYGVRISAGWIIAARDTQWVADSREVLLQSVAWGLGLALALSIGFAFYLARRNEQRIERLSRVLSGAAAGDMDIRYVDPHQTNDDITRVAKQVNAMMDRLSQSMESLRQVSTDVAHDLRSPLTRLRTRLEPHYLRKDLPEDTRNDLQRAMGEMDSIVSVFDAVLRLAQIESRDANISKERVDLAELCRAMHDMMEPIAAEFGHDLEESCGSVPLIINGDRDLLSQAIVNLIENSFKHCTAPTKVSVYAGRDGDTHFCKVCDDGPGIPIKERENVLRRFYRLEKSRNKSGSGLGLSLVAAIVRAHDGSIEISDNSPGLCVSMYFPGTRRQ